MLRQLLLLLVIMDPTGFARQFASTHNAPVHKGRSRIVKIQFKRTGGLSPITNVAGEVHFTDDGATVTSPGGTYHRQLAPEEQTQLQEAGGPVAPAPSRTAPPSTGAVPDAYQFDISVTTADGKTQKLTAPSANLLKWVKGESDKILRHKMQKS
jgi:hypothetical protein